ncbi:MAG: hypothetical protein ACKOSS_05310 [Planctomycetia bacterium]
MLLLALLATLAGPSRLGAAEPLTRALGMPVHGPPLTTLAAGVLARSTHVALGRVARVRDVRGQAVAHLGVERWLGPAVPQAEVTLIVAGPRLGRMSSSQTVLPWFQGASDAAYVFFLWRREGGEAFDLVSCQPLDSLEGLERLRVLEAEVTLCPLADPQVRARRTLDHLLACLEGRGTWTRSYAARELGTLLAAWPAAFDEAARGRIDRAASKATAPALRSALAALAQRLEALPRTAPGPRAPGEDLLPAPLRSPQAVPEQARDDDAPDVVLARLDEVLEGAGAQAPERAALLLRRLGPARQRQAVVDWLAAAGHVAALPLLREHYAREEALEVRAAIVRAHGLLGGAAEVGWLAERLGNLLLQEATLVALARLRQPGARRVLEDFAAARRGGSEEERALAERVDLLLDPSFEALPGEAPAPR